MSEERIFNEDVSTESYKQGLRDGRSESDATIENLASQVVTLQDKIAKLENELTELRDLK